MAKNATELLRRFRNFVENLREMEKLQNESPNVVFKVNNFFDLSEDELRLRLIPFQDFERDNLRFKPNSEDSEMPRLKTVGDRPPFFDWRTKQKVTRIKDQGLTQMFLAVPKVVRCRTMRKLLCVFGGGSCGVSDRHQKE